MRGNGVKVKGFPRYLLKRSQEERYQYAKEYTVAHTVIDHAFKTLLATVLLPVGKQLIFIIGPTRAGKTFLYEWIKDELEALWAPQQHTNPGRIPFVGIEVPSKDRINPSPSDLYIRILEELEEPLLDKKKRYGDVALYRNEENKIVVEPANTARLRRALEKALQYRAPFVLCLDEAQHLLNIGGLSIEDVMDWIKSLANMTKVPVVLFGTYEMLDLLDLSDQLMCRSKIIHLRRYRETGEDIMFFNSTVLAFQKNLPLTKEPDLLKYSEFLRERTVGLIGNLQPWLLSAYHQALKAGTKNLTFEHLKAEVPLNATRAARMEASVSQDEKRFVEIIGEEDEDRSTKPKVSSPEPETFEMLGNPAAKRHSTRVGHRKPGRDRIGSEQTTG